MNAPIPGLSGRLKALFATLPPRGLTLKILLSVMVAWLITALALFGIFSRQLTEQGYADLEARLNVYATDKATELLIPLWNLQNPLVERLMHSYRHNDDLFSISLYDAQGELTARTEGLGAPARPNRVLRAEQPLVYRSGGEDYVLGRIEVLYHDARLAGLLNERRENDAWMLSLVLAVLAGSVWLTMHMIVGRPLAFLERSLRQNAQSARREKIYWSSQDEIGHVVTAYNALLDVVEAQTAELLQANAELRKEFNRRHLAEDRLQLSARVFEVSQEASPSPTPTPSSRPSTPASNASPATAPQRPWAGTPAC